jgi:hypothetical protein
MGKVHRALELSLTNLGCAVLAAIARSSSTLRAAVLAVVTSKSTASYLLLAARVSVKLLARSKRTQEAAHRCNQVAR